MHISKCKNPVHKGYTCYNFKYMTIWKSKSMTIVAKGRGQGGLNTWSTTGFFRIVKLLYMMAWLQIHGTVHLNIIVQRVNFKYTNFKKSFKRLKCFRRKYRMWQQDLTNTNAWNTLTKKDGSWITLEMSGVFKTKGKRIYI